jgi:EEF1A N-terminal glycine/lysine methyltransferase
MHHTREPHHRPKAMSLNEEGQSELCGEAGNMSPSPITVDDESDEDIITIIVGDDIRLSVKVAEDEFNREKKTLFATYVWSGARVLASVLSSSVDRIEGKSVIEFGAAAAVPSLTCARMGAKVVIATDYPSPSVLENIQANIYRNQLQQTVHCLGHVWGSDNVEELLERNGGRQYDVALAAECLWKHETHDNLLRSIVRATRTGGTVLITFSHHIPGLESADLKFFEKAQHTFGLSIISKREFAAPHMWSDKMVTIFLVELCKTE